ncbi:myosin phosphatase Rho interacting protein outspread [Arctopsyche grandis]|uniref:myosin phosphatase Rho interacting protein outspread n=1 Tax=Arctopsyche grandis TaxID=121162 RepID=UPI00406D895C
MSARSDCRKFAPNIFNKSKCSNCFRQKEEHSAEALESNRASRKISKCGYLFVAPGWDFSDPLNRTKRWQRRWFVLYDDGELTYSLDEHPDTVPQASIDMTSVVEVQDADEVTGHPHSLAITDPDRVTFVKGNCREEARRWSDVLSVFPRSKGRHKRNATFPGGQPTSLMQNGTAIRNGGGSASRPRHNSCHAGGWSTTPRTPIPEPSAPNSLQPSQPLATPETKVYTDQPVSSASPPTRDKINSEDKARSRRGAARDRRRAAWDAGTPQDAASKPRKKRTRKARTDERERRIRTNSGIQFAQQRTRTSKTIKDELGHERRKLKNKDTQDVPSNSADPSESVHHRIFLEEYEQDCKREEKLKDIAASLTRPRDRSAISRDPPCELPTREDTPAVTSDHVDSTMPDKYMRGDPDGCVRGGGAAARVELPAEELLKMRKGWLQRATAAGSARHWFVLRGAALLYYRDPSAEDCGIMDGVIDLNGVAAVTEAPGARPHGFLIKTWDNRQYVLSAVTASFRTDWMSAIRHTAGLPDSPNDCPEKLYPEKPVLSLERQDSAPSSDSTIVPLSPMTPVTPITPRSILFSSDDEYRTASEGGRRDSVDWGDPISHLPPSPILNRNPISRVKDKVKSRNLHHSSVPSDILDPLQLHKDKSRKYDLIKPVKSSSYISTIDKQAIEIEDLRKQLKISQNHVNLFEKELTRLNQIKSESVLKEKKIDELLSSLQKTEDELNRRTKEAENLEVLKKRYSQDKVSWERKLSETEAFLRESTERCELLKRQLANGQETIQSLQNELTQLNDKLVRSAEENDNLYLKIKDLGGRNSSLSLSRNKGRSCESLRDLANIDLDQDIETMNKEQIIDEYDELRGRFEKAIQEIRTMKRELRDSNSLYDELEVSNFSLKHDMKIREDHNESQVSMMAARIQDLTQKLLLSDKQVRSLKHKLQKSEARDKRRSLSLKGRESFSIGKEVEEKLTELENKITTLETGKVSLGATPVIKPPSKPASPTKEKSPSKDKDTDSKSLKRMSARLRRKSLDSATSSEPMKLLIRLSSLETKVGNALETKKDLTTSCESLIQTISDGTNPDNSDSQSNAPHRHLLDRLQSLENVVILSRNKVNECLCQVGAIRAARSRRSPSPVLDRKAFSLKSIERCLTDVSKTLQECTDKCVLPFESIYEGYSNDAVLNVVSQLEQQLRLKLLDINEKKCALLDTGKLDQKRNLEFLAEKLAYEAVLIGRINDAIANANGNEIVKRLVKSEVEETSQLVVSLQSKLNGLQTKKQTLFKTSMDYLAKILSSRINFVNNLPMDKSLAQSQSISQMKELEHLKASQKELTISVNQYKSEKLIELTKALIMEARNFQSEMGVNFDQRRANLENLRIQEAWQKARDVVNNELINSEISHVLMRCSQFYDNQLENEKKCRFTLIASQQAALERWFQVTHQRLSHEMKEAISDISACYQECLSMITMRTPSKESRPAVDSQQLLHELADVIAHKALIDAKIFVCTGGFEPDSDIEHQMNFDNNVQEKWKNTTESENIVASLDSDPTQEAEFIYLFQQFSKECRALFAEEFSENKDDLMKISDALKQIELIVKHLHIQMGGNEINNEDSVSQSESQNCIQAKGILELCDSLRKSVEALSTHIPCQQCLRLQSALNRLRTDHEETMNLLRTEQERIVESKRTGDLARARARTAEDLLVPLQQQHRTSLRINKQNETEVNSLKQQIAQHQLECQNRQIQQEHEQLKLKEHARNLEKKLKALDVEHNKQIEQLQDMYHKSVGHDPQSETVRQRYQKEIEQLRALCEKGLIAMESSHRRVIQELEEKHRLERDQLRVDKEQALAEETQATLAALDAMRKAHESEVQKEVSKFKKDFTSRTLQNPDAGQVHSRHQEEMEEIKQEILSLSEKYSVKCVESAALEEKLSKVTQQLTQAQMQLDARNKQLRAHIPELNEVDNLDSLGSLNSSSPHGQGTEELRNHFRRLASTCQKVVAAENQTQSTDLGAGQICSSQNQNPVCKDRKHKKPPALTSPELSGFQRVARCSVSSGRASISPLVGIVAERKKRFEL